MANKLSTGRNGGKRQSARLGKAVILSVAMLCTTSLTPVQAQSYSFSQVRIEGNDRIQPATILNYAGIGRGETVSAGGLNDAYQRILDTGLFQSVELVPSGNTLVIKVQEFPMIDKIAFEGNRMIKEEQLTAVVKSQARRVFSPQQAEADAAAISEAYAGAGRTSARVEPKIIRTADNQVNLVFEISEGKVTEVNRLSFTGNRDFSDRRLRQVLNTKQAGLLHVIMQNDTYNEARVAQDRQLLNDFYQSRGYADFRILGVSTEYTNDRDGFYLTYQIQEGQRYKFGRITTRSEVEGVDAAEFQDRVPFGAGRVYSPNAVDNAVTRMEALATEKGMSFIRVEPQITRNERDGTLDVNFLISRGPRVFVERIDVEGNSTTQDQVIRRQFTTVEGDPFNPTAIKEAARRIKALGFFKNSTVDTKQGSAPDQVIVDVNVEEQPTGTLSFGLSYGVDTGAGVSVSFSESNFLGRGQYFGASINTTSSTGTSSLTFQEPAFLGRDITARFHAAYRISDNDNSDYSIKNIVIDPSLSFPITQATRLKLGLILGRDEVYGIDDDSSYILHQEEGARNKYGLSYEFDYDTRRRGLNPDSSLSFTFGQQLLTGDADAIITTANVTGETKVHQGDWTLRSSLEGGALTMLNGDTSTVSQRFFNNGMRGFESRGIGPRDLNVDNEDPLGGNYYFLFRNEAEFPIGIPEEYGITGGVFLDVGSVWGLDETGGGYDGTDVVDDSMKIRAAAGFSVFWTTPVGPLRFNFSKALAKEDYDEEQNFDLTVSTKF